MCMNVACTCQNVSTKFWTMRKDGYIRANTIHYPSTGNLININYYISCSVQKYS